MEVVVVQCDFSLVTCDFTLSDICCNPAEVCKIIFSLAKSQSEEQQLTISDIFGLL